MVSSYVGSVTQQLSPRHLHLSQSWPLMTPSQGQLPSDRGSSCEYEVPLPYSAAQPAWDLTLEPIWKITAALKGSRQDSCATSTAAAAPTGAPLSPLAQRAANAAVRAAAGWLSPGQWRSAQAAGSAASPRKPAAPARSSGPAAAQPASQPVTEDGLVAFRPRRWLAEGASDLESSITALADALGALQCAGSSQCEAFPSLADLHQPSIGAPCWQAPQPRRSDVPLFSTTAAYLGSDEWDDGEGSVDGELGRCREDEREEAPLQLQRSCSSEFFSACSGSLSASEERCSSAEASPPQQHSPPQKAPLATLPASTIRQNLLTHFPEATAAKSGTIREEEHQPSTAPTPQPSSPQAQVPLFSPIAMAAARGASDLQTPFATACLASPFEAPSPRDMHLSPAEERLVPTPSLGRSCGLPAGESAEGDSPREQAERERALRMLACLWANTEKAPWAEAQPPQADSRKREQPHPQRPAAPPPASCAVQHKSGGATGKRLFGIVGDGQSEWQPLVRECNQMMELGGVDTEWLHDMLDFADTVYG